MALKHIILFIVISLFMINPIMVFWLSRKKLSVYYKRKCTGRAWRLQFPNAKSDDIRNFLWIFYYAFALKSSNTLAFRPDDKLIDIYRAIYPLKNLGDCMEYETLMMDCEERYHVDISTRIDESSTLGDVFQLLQERTA